MSIILNLKYMNTIKNVWFEKERIYVLASDDKVYSRPLEAFPALKDADDKERKSFTIELGGTALRWKDLDEDIHISSFYVKDEPKYDNNVYAIFKMFPQLNVSEVARSMGINKSLLSKYIYGIKTPSPERMEEIRTALHTLGQKLLSV